MDGMAAMARKYQPGLIVVDRTVSGPNENYITPEGEIPNHYLPYPWETCMTMGTSWPWRPNDNFKSVGTLVKNLCHIVARGGNYLIGIGPDAHGEFDPVVYDRLSGLGKWLKVNGEAIYNTRPIAPYEQEDCVFTRKKNGTVYAIILPKHDGDRLPESLVLPEALSQNRRAYRLLGFGEIRPDASGKLIFPPKFREKSAGGVGWALRVSGR
jgi:alpha-L-fucosidase